MYSEDYPAVEMSPWPSARKRFPCLYLIIFSNFFDYKNIHLQYSHTIEYYTPMKKNRLLLHTTEQIGEFLCIHTHQLKEIILNKNPDIKQDILYDSINTKFKNR